jgi:hypothetical protein
MRALGTISHNKPNFFASKMDVAVIKPVMLPPGRLKLAIRPDLIGSLAGDVDPQMTLAL